jgi:hypothetical protein
VLLTVCSEWVSKCALLFATWPGATSGTLTEILGRPGKAEPVPRARWEEVYPAQGMKNPTPGIQVIEGFDEGWIEFEGGFEGYVKGQTSLANSPHRLRSFYKEKNSEDTTNGEAHSWRRDRRGSHLLLRFVERTSVGEENE